MEKTKRPIWQGLICVGLLCVIWSVYFFVAKWIDKQVDVVRDDYSWVYQLDDIEFRAGKVVLRGFAFELNNDAAEESFEIILRDIESEKMIFLRMEHLIRSDVNEYFLCEYDYLKSGFEATIKEDKVDLKNRKYEVLLRAKDERQAYQTGIYIDEGRIVYANPEEYKPLDVIGTDLECIVREGVLRAYRPDYGVYVYQYAGELYWILEPTYEFVDGDTYMQFQLDTTQLEKLPQHRLENQWYWDNISFVFSTAEITALDTGKYRVAKKSLPTEYAINKISIGNYIDDWIWLQEFRPYYE